MPAARRRRSAGEGLAGAVLAAALAAGCRSEPPKLVGRIAMAEGLPSSRLAELGLTPEDLRRSAREAFAATRGFALAPPVPRQGEEVYGATVALLDARALKEPVPGGPADSAVPRVAVALELELAPPGGEESLAESARWLETVAEGEPVARALRRAIDGAARKAAGYLILALAEGAKPDEQVIRDLESGDVRVRDHAVRVLADRRNPAAVPALVDRLKDPDPDVVERAVGALAQIRDPRAVVPLIELSHRREGPFVAQLARVIGDIGGSEAEAYLLTLASGHPEPAVRAAAEEALAELRRRARLRSREGGDAGAR